MTSGIWRKYHYEASKAGPWNVYVSQDVCGFPFTVRMVLLAPSSCILRTEASQLTAQLSPKLTASTISSQVREPRGMLTSAKLVDDAAPADVSLSLPS